MGKFRKSQSTGRRGRNSSEKRARPEGQRSGRENRRDNRKGEGQDTRRGTGPNRKSEFGKLPERRSNPKREEGGFRKEDKTGRGESDRRKFRGGSGKPDQSGRERKWNRKEDHEFYGKKKKSFRKEKPESTSSEDGLTRLNKFIANAGICSRREADEMIEAGVISVNGKVITEMGYKVSPGDVVRYNNSVLKGEKLVYLLLNKPKDFITTTDDPEERKTVMHLIENACKERVYPVGRLDRNTSGVLLFTNDGELATRLMHPSSEVHKVYQVELDSALKPEDYRQILEGLELEDGFIKVDEIAYTSPDKRTVGVEIHSGRNRIVRRIFESLGYRVKKLDRVIFAGLTKKDLPRGRWRFLSELEIAGLKMLSVKKKQGSRK
ncbi:MAG: pseudouridine synthase [Bacteroidetes bacterium]|nr:MAG: pseudouridine synthase [Bacteroidota bacterium]REK04821.1 MAG: pseudouridine synthase [Bacteroidota bacterium]REK51042.1 MAG: pseudouridine synthase [Bacteroidota bacterium]